MSQTDAIIEDLNERATKAVAHCRQNRADQRQKHVTVGRADQGAYLDSPQPFISDFLMMDDCEASNRPVSVQEPGADAAGWSVRLDPLQQSAPGI